MEKLFQLPLEEDLQPSLKAPPLKAAQKQGLQICMLIQYHIYPGVDTLDMVLSKDELIIHFDYTGTTIHGYAAFKKTTMSRDVGTLQQDV